MATGTRLRRLGAHATRETAPVPSGAEPPAVLSQRLAESFGTMSPWGWPQVWQAYQNTAFPGPGGFPYRGASGTTNDRAYGKDIPFFWSEVDLRGYRVTSRYLAETNPFAIGFMNLLVSYHIGKGYGWQACRKGAKKTPYATGGANEDPLIAKAQRILDEFRDRNQWGVLSGEAFYRWRVDGETFLRLGRDEDCGIWCRFVEPEQVGAPDGSTTDPWSYGIEVYEHPDGKIDPTRVLAYHVWDLESGMTGGEWVDAPYMVHAKANVVSNVKRGRPDFFPVLDLFDGARKLWSNMLSSAVRQAAYAWLEQFPTATAAQVGNHIPSVSTGTGQSIPANQATPQVVTGLPWWGQGQRNQEPPGTIMRTEGNRAVVPMPADGRAAGFELIVKLAMRCARAIWSLPGSASGDAEDTTFAAAIQAGGPFPVTVGRSQLKWGEQFEKPTALKVLDLAAAAGELTREERAALDVQTTAPAVVTPEPDKEASTRLSKVQAGLLSKTTAMLEDGKDPQHEFANMEAEKKRDAAGAAPQPSAPAPTDPSAPSAGDQGGGIFGSLLGESTNGTGFTGTTKDSAGHERHYVDGKQVAGPTDDAPPAKGVTKPAAQAPGKPAAPAGKAVTFDPGKPPAGQKAYHSDPKTGTFLNKKADGTLETPMPDEPTRKKLVAALAPAIKKAWDSQISDALQFDDYASVERVVGEILDHAPPGTPVIAVQAALVQLAKDRKIQLQPLNETHTLKTPEEQATAAIWQNDRALGFVFPGAKGSTGIDLSAYKAASESRVAENFTGTDANGHHWQDGKQVKTAPAAPAKPKAAKSPVAPVVRLARDPGADKKALGAFALAAPTDDAREVILDAEWNVPGENSVRQFDDPGERRRYTVERLGAAWRDALASGKTEAADYAASVLAHFGADLHGPAPGESTEFSARLYDADFSVFSGPVKVVRQPVVMKGDGWVHVATKGKVAPLAEAKGGGPAKADTFPVSEAHGAPPKPGMVFNDQDHHWHNPETGVKVPAKTTDSPRNQQQAEILLQHADENLSIGPRHVARANDGTGGPLKGIKRAAALAQTVDRHAVMALRLRAKGAGLTPQESEKVQAAIAHMEGVQGEAERALAKHVTDYLGTVPDAPPVTDPKAARKAVIVDPADYPEALRPAITGLAAKTGSVGALGLGGAVLVAKPKGELARVWADVSGGIFDGEPVGGNLENVWERSKAPVQFAVADVPERAKGRSADDAAAPPPGDAPRYKRLSRDLLLRYDPTDGSHAIVSRATAPETIGVPAWAQSDTGEPPARSGYSESRDAPKV